MDPVSHVALGRTLIGVIPGDRRAPGMVGAAVLGALAPDLDAVLMPTGWDRYLRVHEIGTHALIGVVACAALTAVVVRRFRRNSTFSALFLAAVMGTSSHVALDLVSSARLRLLWPFADGYASVPLVAMADPYLLGLLAIGALAVLVLKRTRERAAAVAALAVVLVCLAVKGTIALRAIQVYDETVASIPPPSPAVRIVEARWARLREWTVF